MGVLGEIIVTLNASYEEDDAAIVINLLKCLPKCSRFSLALDFISKQERQSATELMEKLQKGCEGEEDEDTETSLQEEVSKLREVYQLT